jgi:hypothetical protein
VCAETKKPNDTHSYDTCVGYLARGHVLVELGVNYAGDTRDNSKRLKQAVPLAVAALLTVN